ncbi:MAG: hypothetical protein LWW94_05920 [Candidatus Desulfofervidaceae bacterium]|nr:hypothetical protein [Candidatus Desulfofervidaceae bacterium]
MLRKYGLFSLNFFLVTLAIISFLFLLRDAIRVVWQESFILAEPHFENKTPHLNHSLKLKNYNLILKNNPFGFQAGELRPLRKNKINLISTKGKEKAVHSLTLLGTVTGQNYHSFAIIKNNKTKKQEIFKIGEMVFDIGVLKKVFKNKVLIELEGRPIELYLQDKDLKRVQEIKSARVDFVKKRGNIYILNRKKVEQFIQNPTEFVSGAVLIPNIINGQQNGWLLKKVNPNGIYAMLGLQNGDVLVAVNEYSLSNPEAILQTFAAIQQGVEHLELDVIRNGGKKHFIYQVID